VSDSSKHSALSARNLTAASPLLATTRGGLGCVQRSMA
jgi:hypothetical protein